MSLLVFLAAPSIWILQISSNISCLTCFNVFHRVSKSPRFFLRQDAPASVAKGTKALFEVPAGNMGAVTRAATRVMGIATAVTIPRFNMTMVEICWDVNAIVLPCSSTFKHVQARSRDSMRFNEIRWDSMRFNEFEDILKAKLAILRQSACSVLWETLCMASFPQAPRRYSHGSIGTDHHTWQNNQKPHWSRFRFLIYIYIYNI